MFSNNITEQQLINPFLLIDKWNYFTRFDFNLI